MIVGPDGRRRIRYFSASSLQTGDPYTYGGCNRRYYYEYVEKRKAEATTAQDAGTRLHLELETYGKTGVKALSTLALSGLHLLPRGAPWADVEIESELWTPRPAGEYLPTDGLLTAAGRPVVGKVDLRDQRRDCPGSREPLPPDPPGTVHVADHKSSSDIERYGKKDHELAETLQMCGYGVDAVLRYQAPQVRLSHNYFQTRGRARAEKRTALIPAERLLRRWEYADRLARDLDDVVLAASADDVPANTAACGAYRGCPHRGYCTAEMDDGAEFYFGTSAKKPPNPHAGLVDRLLATLPGGSTMGLLDKLRQPPAAAPATTTTTTTAPAPAVAQPAAPAPEVKLDLSAQVAKIKAEKDAAVAAAARAKAPAGFAEAMAQIEAAGLGRPRLEGAAAQAHASAGGQSFGTGHVVEGVDRLAQLTFTDPADVIDLAAELRREQAATEAPTPAPQPADPAVTAGILPPDAPAPSPAATTNTNVVAEVGALTPAPQPEATAPVKPKAVAGPGRGRKKTVDAAPAATAPTDEQVHRDPEAALISVFVDCRPGFATTDIRPHVDDICRRLAAGHGVIDIRSAPKDNQALAYGGWQGVLFALVALAVRKGQGEDVGPATETVPEIPPGCYHLDARGSNLAEVAADALQSVIDPTGFVRGYR